MAQCKDEIKAHDGSTFFCVLTEDHEDDHVFHKTQSWCPACESVQAAPLAGSAVRVYRGKDA